MTGVIKLPIAPRGGNRDGIWPTATALGLTDIIENCRLSGQLGLITGPSGIGKTTAARAAVAAVEAASGELASPTLVYVSMTRASQGLQPGLLRIAHAVRLGVSNHMGAHDVHDALVYHRWEEGSLLVLDEAQFMSDELLHGVRNIWDELDQRRRPLGIVLVGTLDLAERIKARGKRGVAFEALRGRLGASMELGALEPDDCAAICKHVGLTEKDAVSLISRVAAQAGCLHNVSRLLGQAKRAAGQGNRIAFADLKQAAEVAGGAA